MNLKNQFGRRVQELRTKLDLSQEEFAFKAGIHRTYVTGIESGKRNISLEIVQKVITALNVTYTEFFNSDLFE